MKQRKNIIAEGGVSARGFTLIEVLVVIAIIATLAALLTNLAGTAAEKRRRSQAQLELTQLVTVIEHYKENTGVYPPDNPLDPASPPLFYELAGTQATNTDFITLSGNQQIANVAVVGAFGIPAFANSQPGQAKNFFPNIRPAQHKRFSNSATSGKLYELLVVPVDGPNMVKAFDGKPANPWRYNSSHPTNNVGSFDLWGEITIKGRTEIIGNWSGK